MLDSPIEARLSHDGVLHACPSEPWSVIEASARSLNNISGNETSTAILATATDAGNRTMREVQMHLTSLAAAVRRLGFPYSVEALVFCDGFGAAQLTEGGRGMLLPSLVQLSCLPA